MLADSRWPGRILGCWRDEQGNARTLWARTIADDDSTNAKYLYLRGAPRSGLPPYGLSALLAAPLDPRREILLVEGVIDVHLLRAQGIESVCALGGTSSRPELFERLAGRGVETVTLCLDNDPAGRRATARAVEHAIRADASPALFIVDPTQLGSAKDPAVYVHSTGANRFSELLSTRVCLSQAGSWLGSLPARLALEQEDAIHAVAERCGYSPAAVERAYHARYWPRPTNPTRPHARERDPARTLER